MDAEDAVYDEGVVSEIDHPIQAEVTKPPILAWAALKLHEVAPDEGFLQDADDWNETLALWLAHQEGMEILNESHWQVIYALREYYQGHHHMPSFRQLCEAAHQTDHYCMERLFNNDGTKAWRIAGLPNPGEELKAYL